MLLLLRLLPRGSTVEAAEQNQESTEASAQLVARTCISTSWHELSSTIDRIDPGVDVEVDW